MECVAPRIVSLCSTTQQQQQQQRLAARGSRQHQHQPGRGAVVGPLRATRRGWGETDNRFSRLDKRREGERVEQEYRDTERNISFQELRRRQDREQRKVSVSLTAREAEGTDSNRWNGHFMFCYVFSSTNRRHRRFFGPLFFFF